MSIINDALKKLQTDIDKGKDSPPIKQDYLQSDSTLQKIRENAAKDLPKEPTLKQQTVSDHKKFRKYPIDANVATNPNKTRDSVLILFSSFISLLFLFLTLYIIHNNLRPRIAKTESYEPEIIKSPAQKQQNPIPQETPQDPFADITIFGIMSMDNINVALINNKIYEIGDEINGMRITDIKLDYVTFLKGTEEVRLKVVK